MKKTGACIWIWWCWCMIAIKLVITLDQQRPIDQFDLRHMDFDNYKSFLEDLRNKVASDTNYCSIPTTAHITKSGAKYIHVVLSAGNKEITIGITVEDLYVWGYKDKCDNKIRATFVADAKPNVKRHLFPKVEITRFTNFKCSYTSLQNKIGPKMWELELGINDLMTGIQNVYGKHVDKLDKNNNEAKFFFMVIQMVSEAARFKFIEEAIINNNNSESIRAKRQDFEKNWDDISKAFYKAQQEPDANSKCTEFNPSLKIGNSRGFKHVDDLKSDLGILKSQESSPNVGVGIA